MSNLSFAGRVAIVTGAGGALGRAYALHLSSRGASVVVNDLGGSMQGAGSNHGPAEQVVREITAAGGKAVANYDSVLEGDKIVQAAIAAFGRVDIVINNAGVLRDVSFAKMSQEQWDVVHRVHLQGAISVTKAAWPHMMRQKYGRIIMTASSSGIYGNRGQANYSSAKLALVGFASSLAKEGLKNNVLTNTIAPVAGSRMTESIMPPDLIAALDPKTVAPIVAFLCHESSTQNGCVYESGAGYCAQVRFQRSAGVHFPLSAFTPEAIASKMDDINDFKAGSTYPTGLNDTMSVVIGQLSAAGGKSSSSPSQLSAVGANAEESFQSDAVFEQLSTLLKNDPSIATKINATFQYNLTSKSGAKKVWTIALKKNAPADAPRVYVGPLEGGAKPDVTVDVSDADYVALAVGKASAQMLYMKGRLKMKGNLPTAMKFDAAIKQARSKL